jgi:hypothetical protein
MPPKIPVTTRRALEDLVSGMAIRLSTEPEPDLDEIDSLSRLTASLASLITARAEAHNRRA